jgi:hypothetical protein
MLIDITPKICYPVDDHFYRGAAGGLSRDVAAEVSGPIQFRGEVFGVSV